MAHRVHETWISRVLKWIDGIVAYRRGFMPSRIAIPSLVLLVLIFLAGCSSTVPPEELTKTRWVLVSYLDERDNQASVPPLITAAIEFQKDGQITGFTGCNNYVGTYRIDGGLITISDLGSTEKYCPSPEGIMNFEDQYLSLLSDTTRYNLDGNELTLSHYDERKLLVFHKM
jgi:heat shock protein HslJ